MSCGELAIILVGAFALLHLPIGRVLDAAAAGLLLGMAIGRPGCIFAGCCGGRLMVARWGMCASDRRVGARRIPTQLLESLGSLAVGLAALLVLLAVRIPLPGVVFVGGLAADTL